METQQRNEARDAAMIGAFFLGYAALVWYAAVRAARPTTSFSDRVIDTVARAFHGHAHDVPTPALEFARSIRDELIAEENA